jgi:hypothetical protein
MTCGPHLLNIFFKLVVTRGGTVLFAGKLLAGNSILAFNPLAKVDKLAPFGTEGTKRIVFPLG